ncbi:PTH2-domain-containing protein [Schizopora paradoxa]|uniref:peptidyl-tRNA hydrolase n=1 Tax=Schizopora paradoxa TaxID=27342 RepID=A0A0H2S9K4_9AGAM|nr:PTH2-domain-containing protein [Schizopora paradoxa]
MSSSSSPVSTYAALAIVSLTLGYWAGVGSSLKLTRSSPNPQASTNPSPKEAKPKNEDAEADESDEEAGEDLSAVKAGLLEDCKLVLVVRTDLGMTSGKIAAQCSHATLACYKALAKSNPSLLRHWERTGQTKVALRCDSEDDLDLLEASARSLNLCARSIHDAGRTQIAAGSRTVLGIGPGPTRLVNQITGKLRLL